MEYTFLDNQINFCRLVVENNELTLYQNENIVLKSQGLKVNSYYINPIPPIYDNKYLVLIDYDKGVQIIDDYSSIFLKIKAVWNAFIVNDILILVKHKTICFIDCKTKTLIKSINQSENYQVAFYENYVLFYRLHRNNTYLWDSNKNKIYHLINIGKSDEIIRKIIVQDNILYIMKKKRLEKYNLVNDEFTEEISVDGPNNALALGPYYLRFIKVNVNKDIIINLLTEPIQIMKQIYSKFGLFVMGDYANEINYQDDYFKSLVEELHDFFSNSPIRNLKSYDQYIRHWDNYGVLEKKFEEYFDKI